MEDVLDALPEDELLDDELDEELEDELEEDESEDLVVDFSDPEGFLSEEPLSDERESVR